MDVKWALGAWRRVVLPVHWAPIRYRFRGGEVGGAIVVGAAGFVARTGFCWGDDMSVAHGGLGGWREMSIWDAVAI